MRSAALRIIHVVSSLQIGGMEHLVLRLAESQRACGDDASVVGIRGGPLLDVAAENGVPVTILQGASIAARVLHAAGHFLRMNPQIVHCHNPTSLHYATLAKFVGAPRIVFTDHAQTKGIVRIPRAYEWQLVDAYAAVSVDTARHARNIGYREVPDVVHNGVEFVPATHPRAKVRADWGLDNQVVGINVARLSPVKAQDTLVRAVALLKSRGVLLTTIVVGDGPERGRVESLAAELGLGPEHVRFLGFRSDIADLLEASDFFVLPSRSEGLPLTLLEAMSHGLPVVCTSVGGNTELVGDGEHGYVVPVDDPPRLADAMARITADAELRHRMGESGRARALGEFGFDRTRDGYQRIYRRVLAAPGRKAWAVFHRDRIDR
jgi:glycosyltransferase involved in cell wall biosynthesis